MHPTVVGIEATDEDRRRARVVFGEARIGHARFALKALPGDAGNRAVHGLTHLFKDLRHTRAGNRLDGSGIGRVAGEIGRGRAVVPGQPDAIGDRLDDPEIGACVAWRCDGLLAQLHHPVGIADRAVFLWPGGGRQHHIGEPGGLGHEDVLHHQMLEAGQGMTRMVQVGVAHGRVLAHDVHASDLVRIAVIGQHLVQDLDHGIARLIVQRRVPESLEPGMRRRVGDALIVGEHHRNQAGVAGALHIVLAAKRMQPRAGLADLAGDRGQRNQAAGIVGAVHMLAHAHAPQDHCAAGGRKSARHFAQRACRNAADRRHRLGAVGLDRLAQGFEVAGALGNEGLIDQPFVDDGMDERIEHRDIGVGIEGQGAPGMLADVGDARVGEHDLRAPFGRVLHPGRGHRMVGGRVRADHEDQLGMFDIVDLVAHRA